MKILIVDTALALDLGRRLAMEGHKVFYFVNWIRAHPLPEEVEYGKGIMEYFGIQKVDNFYSKIDEMDLIVVTDIGWGEDIEAMRGKGIPIFGGGGAEILESDRARAKELVEEVGIKIPKTWSFKNSNEAISEMRNFERNKKYAIKVNLIGDAFTKTYIAVNLDDAFRHLKLLKEKMVDVMGVVVEEFIDGIEYAVGGFFNGDDFVGELCFNFEHKRYFPGNISCNTGEMGTVFFWEKDGKLYRDTLMKIKDILKDLGFIGYFDLNFIVNHKGAFFLEATARFGYPLLSGQLVSLDINFGEFMLDCVKRKSVDLRIKDSHRWCVIVCINTPPIFQSERFVLYGIDLEDPKFGLADVMMENGILINVPVSTALYQRLINCCGIGLNLKEARENAYKVVSKVKMKDMTYRIDIGEALLENELEQLAELGYEEVLSVRG